MPQWLGWTTEESCKIVFESTPRDVLGDVPQLGGVSAGEGHMGGLTARAWLWGEVGAICFEEQLFPWNGAQEAGECLAAARIGGNGHEMARRRDALGQVEAAGEAMPIDARSFEVEQDFQRPGLSFACVDDDGKVHLDGQFDQADEDLFLAFPQCLWHPMVIEPNLTDRK